MSRRQRPEEHTVFVVGDWHNDDTGGFHLWCETCDWYWEPPESQEENGGAQFCVQDEPTPLATVVAAADQHRADVLAEVGL